MAPLKVNVMRQVRLQLKTGFLWAEPPEYIFMKRHPPSFSDARPKYQKIEARNIPYLDLFNKAMDRNPKYAETVYPAYWQQEPQQLVLAKKQYQFMMAGDDEETAFKKATDHLDVIENKAYVELRDLREVLKTAGAKAPFMFDASIVAEILKWQEKIGEKRYSQLDVADQGDLDFMIQTKIMKWNEVERERRMCDPIFVAQFEQVRRQLFPPTAEFAQAQAKMESLVHKATICAYQDVDYTQVKTAAPFYLEDYVTLFKMVKAQPDVRRWNRADIMQLSNWIVDTLAFREVVDADEYKTPAHEKQRYLDNVKFQFFPILRQPERAEQFEVPTVEGMRRLLYESDVGYKTQDGKVFVRRFYKLPAMLFPESTFVTKVIYNSPLLV